MASRLSKRLNSRATYGMYCGGWLSKMPLTAISLESLWSNGPPSFLVPAFASWNHPLTTTASLATTIKKTRRQDPRDTYALRQAKQRKDANLSRQAVLKEQRAKELGDPIRGLESPFVKSFDTVVPQQVQLDPNEINLEALKADTDQPSPSPAQASNENHLDHGMKHEELAEAIEYSRSLTEPPKTNDPDLDPLAGDHQSWELRTANAAEAVQRIVSLNSGSSKHRTKKNIERIIETFGRHNTDHTLRPKAPAVVKRNLLAEMAEPTPRAGPDTGSSEVQIGILTAKIRVLADRYEGENRNDKINKRNLRLLLHRRQKLLSYMEKKERGSERWQNMVTLLGLTPACWKGQIAVE